MADDELTVPDWLGRAQPLGRKALELTTSSAGGGVTAPVTPPAPGVGGAGRQFAQDIMRTPGQESNPLALALRAAGLGRNALNLAQQFVGARGEGGGGGGINPDPNAAAEALQGVTAAARPGTLTFGGQAITPEQAAAIRAAGGIVDEVGAATSEGPQAGVSQTGTGEGAGVLGAAALAAKAGLNLSSIASSKLSDADKAALALNEIGMDVASYFSFGIPIILDQAIQLFGGPSEASVFADLFGLGGGRYGPTRQRAGQAAVADLSGLAANYRAAAASGDPAQVLTALATPQGERGAVRSYLTLPPNAVPGLSGTVAWGALSPGQFSQVLNYFRANPDAIMTSIGGSGDVGYLNTAQATQVGDQAAQDARALIQFMLSQSAPPAVPAAPAAPAALTTTGPSGALGFAADLLNQS